LIAFGLFCLVQLLVNGREFFFDFAGEAKTSLSDVLSMTATAIGGLAIGGVAVMQYRKHKWGEYQAKLEEDTRTGERLSKAIEHLGDKELHIRLGAIHELKRLAEDSERDRMSIGQILLRFIHSKTKGMVYDENSPLDQDAETAIRMLLYWPAEFDEGLYAVHMHLEGIWLKEANLGEANFAYAHLDGANLEETQLSRARLCNAHLVGASLKGASLYRANLLETHLEGTDFRNTRSNDTILENFSTAIIDDNTRFDPGVRLKYFGVEEPPHPDVPDPLETNLPAPSESPL